MTDAPPNPHDLRGGVLRIGVVGLAVTYGTLATLLIGPLAEVLRRSLTPLPPSWAASTASEVVLAACASAALAFVLLRAIPGGETKTLETRVEHLSFMFVWSSCVFLPGGVVMLHALLTGTAFGEALRLAALGMMLGLCAGLPGAILVGTLFGVLLAGPAIRLRRLVDRPSVDGPSRAASLVGTAALITGLVATAVTVALAAWSAAEPWRPSVTLPGVVAAIGLAVRLWARGRQRALASLREAQRDGRDWTRIRIDELPEPRPTLALAHADVADEPTHVLCRIERAGDAYRGTERLVPWAYANAD